MMSGFSSGKNTLPLPGWMVAVFFFCFLPAGLPADDPGGLFPLSLMEYEYSGHPGMTDRAATVDFGYQYRQKGMRALGDGIYNTAIRLFSAYRAQTDGNEPDFTDATILLLRARLLDNDLAAARRELDYYDHHSPGTEDEFYRRNMLFWRAVVLVAENRSEQGLEVVEPLLADDLYPELQEQVFLLVGEAYARLGDWPQAETTMAEFLTLFPESQWQDQAMFMLFRIALAQGDWSGAEERLQLAAESMDAASPRLTLKRLLLHLGRDELEDALEAYQAVKDEAPAVYDRIWWLVFSQLSRELIEAERWEEALPVLFRTGRLAPGAGDRAGIMLLQVEGQLALGLREEAKLTLSSFINQFPDHPRAPESLFRLGMLAADMEDRDVAINHYRDIVEDTGLPVDLRYQCAVNLGRLLMAESEYQKAGEVFSGAHDLPLDPDYRAAALMLAAGAAEAAAEYELAATRYATVAEEFRATEYAAVARSRQARALLEAGLKSEAASVFALLVNEHPDDTTVVVQAWLGKATALRDHGDTDGSIAAYEAFVEAHADHEQAPMALMEIYRLARQEGDIEGSLQALARICTEYPDSDLYSEALYQRVYAGFLSGDYDLAITEGERFIDDFSHLTRTADVLLWIADHYVNRGEHDRAGDKYRQVFTLHPQSRQARVALYEAAALAFFEEGGPEGSAKALRWLTRLEEMNREGSGDAEAEIWSRAGFLRGDVLASQNRFAEAIAWYEQVPVRTADEKLALLARGRVADMHFSLGSRESMAKALSIYREILASETLAKGLRDNIAYRLGKAMEKLDRRDEALDVYLDIVFTYDIESRAGRIRDWYYFARAGYNAARLLLAKDQPAAAARVYDRIYQSEIPTAGEAAQRAREIREGYGL